MKPQHAPGASSYNAYRSMSGHFIVGIQIIYSNPEFINMTLLLLRSHFMIEKLLRSIDTEFILKVSTTLYKRVMPHEGESCGIGRYGYFSLLHS